jgi:hypothetical protein
MSNAVTREYIEDLLSKAEVKEHIIFSPSSGEKAVVVIYKLESG